MKMVHAEKKFAFTGHTGPVYALEYTDQSNLFFSGSGDGHIVAWNLKNHEHGTAVCKAPGFVYALKYFPKANLLFAGQSNGGIHVINVAIKKEVRLLAYHQGPVFDLYVSEKFNMLISSGGDGIINLIALDGLALLKTIFLGAQKIRALSVNEPEGELMVGCQDGAVVVVDLFSQQIKRKFQAHKEGFSVNALRFIPSLNLLVSGSRDAYLNIFDVKNNFALVETIPAHNYAIYHIVGADDLPWFATASRDKTIKLWNLADRKPLLRIDNQQYGGHLNSVNRLLWLPAENRLISGSDDRSVIEWELHFD